MSRVEEMLAKFDAMTANFLELAGACADSVADLSDDGLTEIVGDSALRSAVMAHRIVGKLRDAAGHLEVMAYSLDRLSGPEAVPPGISSMITGCTPTIELTIPASAN